MYEFVGKEAPFLLLAGLALFDGRMYLIDFSETFIHYLHRVSNTVPFHFQGQQ